MLQFLFSLKNFSTPESVLLLILRLLFGILLMWHGLTKMSNFESLVATFPNPLGLGSRFSLYMIIFVEVFCSVGVIFGAFYRLALIPMIFFDVRSLRCCASWPAFCSQGVGVYISCSFCRALCDGCG
jgi:putative oxidoreductase